VADLPLPLALAVAITFGYFVVVIGCNFGLTAAALWGVLRNRKLRRLASDIATTIDNVPRVSILVPASNEEVSIGTSVSALLQIDYPNVEVIVVNDGSSDLTMSTLKYVFDLEGVSLPEPGPIFTKPLHRLYRSRTSPALWVADKANGGKGDALNAALNLSTGVYMCAVDADTLIDPSALRRLVPRLIKQPRLVGLGATIGVVNGCRIENGQVIGFSHIGSLLAGFQWVEYLRAFAAGRLGWNGLGGNMLVSGAFGLFRSDAVIAAQGYATDTVGEDLELVVRLRRLGYDSGSPVNFQYVNETLAWTEVPNSAGILGRQRDRWHRGLASTLWRHRSVIGNPRYGALGLLGLPYLLIVEWLAPVVAVAAFAVLVATLVLSESREVFLWLYVGATYGVGLLLLLGALAIAITGREIRSPLLPPVAILLFSLAEPFGYHQLTVVWRLRGLYRALRGRREWGGMARQGFGKEVASRQATYETSRLAEEVRGRD
jgi:cellulose synthase/poly-beta-1,6-N-acetylglucosamine synthase-like glycosyltransferase